MRICSLFCCSWSFRFKTGKYRWDRVWSQLWSTTVASYEIWWCFHEAIRGEMHQTNKFMVDVAWTYTANSRHPCLSQTSIFRNSIVANSRGFPWVVNAIRHFKKYSTLKKQARKSKALYFKYTTFDFLSLNDVTALKIGLHCPPPRLRKHGGRNGCEISKTKLNSSLTKNNWSERMAISR